MTPDEAEKKVRAEIAVTPQRVTVAKALLLDVIGDHHMAADQPLAMVVAKNGGSWPLPMLVIHPSIDSLSNVRAIADSISWRVAAVEAMWSLIHGGLLFSTNGVGNHDITVSWTTVGPGGGGGSSSGFQVPEGTLPVPHHVRRAPSARHQNRQFLSAPDLYLQEFGVKNMHPQVSESFTEAVQCFRLELYTAAMTMLGRASEGAWLELGRALLRLVPPSDEKRFAKQRDALEDPMLGPMKKVEAVIQLYAHADFATFVKGCGVRVADLRDVANWSDTVRDSRNTIHFDVQAAVPNTYEKLGVLLIGAVPHVRTLYSVKNCADTS